MRVDRAERHDKKVCYRDTIQYNPDQKMKQHSPVVEVTKSIHFPEWCSSSDVPWFLREIIKHINVLNGKNGNKIDRITSAVTHSLSTIAITK